MLRYLVWQGFIVQVPKDKNEYKEGSWQCEICSHWNDECLGRCEECDNPR